MRERVMWSHLQRAAKESCEEYPREGRHCQRERTVREWEATEADSQCSMSGRVWTYNCFHEGKGESEWADGAVVNEGKIAMPSYRENEVDWKICRIQAGREPGVRMEAGEACCEEKRRASEERNCKTRP
jgi:hypothetical protein